MNIVRRLWDVSMNFDDERRGITALALLVLLGIAALTVAIMAFVWIVVAWPWIGWPALAYLIYRAALFALKEPK